MSNDAQSQRLVDLAHQAFELGWSDDGTPFAIDPTGPNVALPLRGQGGLRTALAHLYQLNYGRPPNAGALADALVVLEGYASMVPPVHLPLRVARHQDGIVLDLGNTSGQAVRIDSTGWTVLSRSPITFRRTALTGLLPVPCREGSLNDLRRLLNVADRSWPLVVGVLVAALIPDIPHPATAFLGEQGTGKSTCARLLVRTIDDGPVPLRQAARDVESWSVAASGSHVVAVDNISGITPWLSDAICRAVTGDGLVRRQLYTDSSLSVLSFRRVVMLTSIDTGALRGDLADRLVVVQLEPIDPSRRRTEGDLDADFASCHSAILGGLLDLLVAVLIELPHVSLDAYPRMADFARILAAIDAVTGLGSLAAYLALADSLADDVVESDLVATALLELAREGDWEGTASQLLGKITPDPCPRTWPATPRALSHAIERCAPALRQRGVEVERSRDPGRDRRRIIRISTDGPQKCASD